MHGPERRTGIDYAVLTAVVLAVVVMGIALTQVARAQAPVTSMSEQSLPHGCSPAWYVVPSQDVGANENNLYSVAAIGPNDVWAVGSYTGTGRYLTLIEHWDGGQWNIVPSPSPGGYNNFLVGVSAVASDDVWAVGSYNNDSFYSTHHLLTIHWDGMQWNEVPNPDPGGNYENYLTAVDARASDDVW